MRSRRPYTAKVGMDAIVVRADGSSINFGDAIYHPENADEAREYAALPSPDERQAGLREALTQANWVEQAEEAIEGGYRHMEVEPDLLLRVIRRALAAPAQEKGLDVERAWKAMSSVDATGKANNRRHWCELVAAEYRALGVAPTEPMGGKAYFVNQPEYTGGSHSMTSSDTDC